MSVLYMYFYGLVGLSSPWAVHEISSKSVQCLTWQQEHEPSSSSSPSQHLMPLLLILIICLFLQEPFLIVAGVCGFLLGFCAMLNHSHSFLSLPQNGPGSSILPLFCNLPPHTAGVRVLLFVLGFLVPLCCVSLHCGKDVQSWWGRPLLSELVGYRAAFI